MSGRTKKGLRCNVMVLHLNIILSNTIAMLFLKIYEQIEIIEIEMCALQMSPLFSI